MIYQHDQPMTSTSVSLVSLNQIILNSDSFQMASKYRNLIAAKSINVLQSINQGFQANNRAIASKLRLRYDGGQSKIWMSLPTKSLPSLQESDLSRFVQKFPLDEDSNLVSGLDIAESQNIKFHLNTKHFTSQVLKTTLKRPADYDWSRNALFPEKSQRVIVEFR